MQFKTKLKLNPRVEIEMTVEGKDFEDVIRQADPLLAFDGVCGICGKDNITLTTMTSKDGKYTYTKFICKECGASATFGKRRVDGTSFLKDWEPKYEG